MSVINIAIDGPSGAGKSTVAKQVAKKFGFGYVDTGALYRAVGYYFYKNKIAIDKGIENLSGILAGIEIVVTYVNFNQLICVNGEDVTDKIRTPVISSMASELSALGEVREKLLDIQRNTAANNSVVMDGRDIATVVLPDAQIKLFLTASVDDRANRRYLELKQRGEDVCLVDVKKDIEERDYRDSNRAIAPLKQAIDSILVDTTGNELDESIAVITKLIGERLEHVL